MKKMLLPLILLFAAPVFANDLSLECENEVTLLKENLATLELEGHPFCKNLTVRDYTTSNGHQFYIFENKPGVLVDGNMRWGFESSVFSCTAPGKSGLLQTSRFKFEKTTGQDGSSNLTVKSSYGRLGSRVNAALTFTRNSDGSFKSLRVNAYFFSLTHKDISEDFTCTVKE